MRLQDICETVNPNVTFKYTEDSEGDDNRGWTVDKIDAYLDGQKVGYLKMAYIPFNRFKRRYPGILNWMAQIGGHHTLPYEYRDLPWQIVPIEQLRSCIYSIAQTAGMSWTESNKLSDQAKTMDQRELSDLMLTLEDMLWKEKGWQFNRFKQYYVDKPVVDYIHVDDEYKRQGIGAALIHAGTEWMKSKGLKLYASAVPDQAKAAWSAIEKKFPMSQERIHHPTARSKRIIRKHFT